MTLNYDYSKNLHTTEGPREALKLMLEGLDSSSILDVGCGQGHWLNAAENMGIIDVIGIDGNSIEASELLFPSEKFKQLDLNEPWNLQRKFDVLICLEVAEHLDEISAECFIKCLCNHSNLIFFSAACPDQMGQNHVHCRWPAYWQKMFNDYGFICIDEIRFKLWNCDAVEPWYRQNMFAAVYKPGQSGNERRILPIIHPNMVRHLCLSQNSGIPFESIKNGLMPLRWYFSTLSRAFLKKLVRIIHK